MVQVRFLLETLKLSLGRIDGRLHLTCNQDGFIHTPVRIRPLAHKKYNMYKINWTPEKKTEVINALDTYFKKYPYAESILQSDKAQENGLQLLYEISDIIQPIRDDVGESISYNWDNSIGDHTIF